MSKPTHTQPQPVKDNVANMVNSNTGTKGTNIAYDQAQGNRGKQVNPTYRKPK